MSDLQDLIPLAKSVIREILEDTMGKDTVRSELATKVLMSEGKMRGPKTDSAGRTFVLNLKTDDVVGALQGMRTVFGDPLDEFGEPIEREVRKIARPRRSRKTESSIKNENDQLKKIIAAEKGDQGL